MVRAPAINTAPRMGAKNIIIFQYAGLCALMTFNWALKYRARKIRPANAAVEWPEGNDSRASLTAFRSPVQTDRSYM